MEEIILAINLATGQFSKKVADAFYKESVIAGRTNQEYSWDGVKSINVWTIVTQDPGNYTRSGTSRYGTPTDVEDTYQTLTITQDKSVSMVVDKGNNKQQMMIKNAGKVLALELREKFVPMADKYAFAQWNTNRGAYTVKSATLSNENIIAEIGRHITYLGNHFVPLKDCACYISMTNFALLLDAKEFMNLEKLGDKAVGEGVVGKVRGLESIAVPDSYLPSGVNFMTIYKGAVLLPFQIKETKVHEDAPGISGALMEIRYLYDAFVLTAKKDGVISCLDSAPSAE